MMDESIGKELAGREADSVKPGRIPAESVTPHRQGPRRRAIVGAGAVTCALAAAAAIGISHSSGAGGNQHAVQEAHDAVTRGTVRPGAPGPVVATSHVDAALKQYYPKIADLLASSAADAIVAGTVAEVAYESAEGIASTVLTVEVTENLLNTTTGTITVREDGGYLPASEVIAELKDKDPEAKPSLDPSGYVDVQFEGAPHPQAGDRVVLVLAKDPNVGREGDYMEVSSVYGRFILDDEAGTYQRTGDGGEVSQRASDGSEFQTTVSMSELQSLLKSVR